MSERRSIQGLFAPSSSDHYYLLVARVELARFIKKERG